ncbi:hypothetical protein AVEN_7845-1 [Araneus ventricosus]|uniref:Uncharacterized protein n=1 Tax=Araneus ventricosus TaxID=182803 RepID=A0A4Y2F394_ARAVE|nr:hypothetical protein AVEN_7845-1 [Araneus ventricosus]
MRCLFQCGRELRGDSGDESSTGQQGDNPVETSGYLQELLRDRRRILSIRRADLSHEIRLVDLRRVQGRSAAQGRGGGHEPGRNRHRPERVLSERRVGHPRRARHPEREVLHVLRGAVHRHHLQHQYAAQDAFLHGQPHYSMHGHILPNGPGFLPALGLGRESVVVHLDSSLADCLLPAAGRDHPAHLAGGAAARQVPALHHDTSHALHLRHGGRAQRPLQVSHLPIMNNTHSFQQTDESFSLTHSRQRLSLVAHT